MKNILIIYTHPNHESLNYSMLQSVVNGLEDNPTDYSLSTIDLYKDNFEPALIFNKEKRRRDLHQDPETALYRESVKKADHLVFVYPIWWGRPPAMLMGFFDRVFVTNFAYSYGEKGFQINKLLKGKDVTCISTMMGPTGYTRLFHGNAHKNLMRKALFNFVGMKKVRFFEFGGMESKTGKQDKALGKVHRYFATAQF